MADDYYTGILKDEISTLRFLLKRAYQDFDEAEARASAYWSMALRSGVDLGQLEGEAVRRVSAVRATYQRDDL